MISIKVLLEACSFSTNVVAGEMGLVNRISTVTVLDALDGPSWLKGEEFVLSSTYIFADNNETFFDFVRNLISNNASGLGVKLSRYFKKIPNEIIRYADEMQFPIIVVDPEIVWSDMINIFHEIRMEQRQRDAVFAISPIDLNAILNTVPLGTNALLQKLADILHGEIAAISEDLKLCFATDTELFTKIINAKTSFTLTELSRSPSIKYGEYWLIARKVTNRLFGAMRPYLILATPRSVQTSENLNLIDFVCNSSNVVKQVKKHGRDEQFKRLLTEIIFHDLPESRFENYVSELDILDDQGYVMARCQGENIEEFIDIWQNEMNKNADHEKTDFYIFYKEHNAVYLLLIYSKGKENNTQKSNSLRNISQELITSDNQWKDIYIYLGSACDSLKNINSSYEHSRVTRKLASVLWPNNHVIMYSDIAIFNKLAEIEPEPQDMELINLLIENKHLFNFDSLQTLNTYLEFPNYKLAAGKLFIHENTLRYRITRISEILQIDLDDPVIHINMLLKIKLYNIRQQEEESAF